MADSQTQKVLEATLDIIAEKTDDIKTFPVYSSDIFPNRLMHLFNLILSGMGSQTIIVPAKQGEMVKESIILQKMILSDFERFDRVRELLCDEKSKEVYNWVLKYRLAYAFIGIQALFLFDPPISPHDFRIVREKTKRLKKGGYYHLNGFRASSNEDEILTNWLLNQYKYEPYCIPEPGDYIFDVGACAGETSIWFVSEIESVGKVYALEPDAQNFEVLVKNIELNNLQDSIIPLHYGLWDANQKLSFSKSGSQNTISEEGGKISQVVRLDDLISEQEITKVDYIKMDIEGAEMGALRGAERTIKKFKPKLAISVYHKASDLIDIPLFISSLVPEYRFYLKHSTIYSTETVLFCVV